ncbi:MAG: hypothetical protein WCI71_03425 [Bacteroidota bacterium]
MQIRRRTYQVTILIYFGLLVFLFSHCMPGIKRELSRDKSFVKDSNQYLKAHMNDGSLYFLNQWITLDSGTYIQAKGEHYNENRKLVASSADSSFTIEMSKVALFESNKITGLGGKIGLQTLVMAPVAIITIYCMINPKACFGSCPTFYAWNGTKMKLMAEGFSSSIARVFEKTDIDMLHSTVITGREYKLQLTNEALETHAIKFADLLVIPRKADERIFATPSGTFYSTHQIILPSSCIAPEGDCLEKVLTMDQSERFSTADPSDLTQKETVEITFNHVPPGKSGLIVGSRQTLLTTFLFYQGMAHAGSKMPYYLAQVESGNETMQHHMTRIWDLLGGIEILVQNKKGKWEKAGELLEMGPIAADLQLVTLPEITGDEVNVKLRMTKGLWRIDQIALINIDQEVQPTRIKPARVMKDSVADDAARILLADTTQYLVTFPGDRYDLFYELPEGNKDYELFLYSRGYYLEWMRENWIAEESNSKMALMFAFPKYYLKMMAPEFKKIEPVMEESFWGSRYVKN